MRLSTLPLSALALGLMAAGTAAAAPYAITNLGTLGGNHSYAYAINDSGLVVGHSSGPAKSDNTMEFAARAFRYNGSTMENLGHLGLNASYANDINNNGTVVGRSPVNIAAEGATTTLASDRGFVYAGGAMTNIGLVPDRGAKEASAEGINDLDVIAGKTRITVKDSSNTDRAVYRGFTLDRTTRLWTILPVFDTETVHESTREAFALGINNAGTVMGSAGKLVDGTVVTRAYRWNRGDTKLTDLGGLSGKLAYPTGINSAGKIVGQATLNEFDASTGALINQGFLSEPGNAALQNLGYLSAAKKSSYPLGINDKDQVVGYSAVSTLISTGSASDLNHAFLSEVRSGSRVMLDLNNMLSCEDRKRWVLIEARGINYRGQIAGVGTFDGQVRAFLLNPPTGEQSGTVVDCPVTEPSSGGGGGSLAGGLLALLAGLGLARRAVPR